VNKGPILAVDPGEKNIGIAISDSEAKLARPLQVIKHLSLRLDIAQIVALAEENSVQQIIIGFPTGGEGELIRQSRHSLRMAEEVKVQTTISVLTWNEDESTQQARQNLLQMRIGREKRGGHQDALAAAVILQAYLDHLSE
jgi:putative Holliday junction resolvase